MTHKCIIGGKRVNLYLGARLHLEYRVGNTLASSCWSGGFSQCLKMFEVSKFLCLRVVFSLHLQAPVFLPLPSREDHGLPAQLSQPPRLEVGSQ